MSDDQQVKSSSQDYEVLGDGSSETPPPSMLPIWSVVKKVKTKATLTSSVFNLANTILGSGVIAMPYACKKSGWVMFMVMLMVVAFASDYAVKLLFLAVETMTTKRPRDIDPEHVSYSALGRVMKNKRLEMIGSWSVTLQQIGCCIAYVVVIGDIFEPLAKHFIYDDKATRSIVQILTLVLVIFPLTLIRKFDTLKFTSFVAIACIMAFVVLVIVYGLYGWIEGPGGEIREGEMKTWPSGVDMLTAFPIMSFAYLCHQNTFPIYRELSEPSPERMNYVSHFSIAICTFVYLGSGIFGYSIAKHDTESDLFNNFDVTGGAINTAVDIVSVGFGVAIVFSYPIVVWEARRNLQHLLFGQKEFAFSRYVMLNASIVIITGVVGIVASGIEKVLGLVGSTCSPMMIYVLPPLLYFESKKFLSADELKNTGSTDLGAKALLLFGIVLIPLCVTLWILGLANVLS
jgi:solute carrier family 38 (sodium-coupled neutral amino acid transporter), member 2